MIKMSKNADYGMVLLMQFLKGGETGEYLSARYLSEETGLSLPMVSKVLKVLTREGLLLSHRGVSGGYSLSRRASEITVGQVLSAMEGPIAMTSCLEDDGDCQQVAVCPARTNWERINIAVKSVLDSITLEDMLDPLPDQLINLSGSELETSRIQESVRH
jgi:FeS assembly SUF system regulator